MVTGQFGWRRASLESEEMGFYKYVEDGDYLLKHFDISHEANEIFKSIFTLEPLDRTSLPKLRKRIQSTSSFGSGKRKVTKKLVSIEEDVSAAQEMNNSKHSKHVSAPCTPIDQHMSASVEKASPPPGPPRRRPIATAFHSMSSNRDNDKRPSSPESSEDSDGPETPETHAVDRGISVEGKLEALDLAASCENIGRMPQRTTSTKSAITHGHAETENGLC
jgi:hypothetical protein